MALPQNNRRVARFGVFELDLSAGELRKSGVKLRLQGQPFQVLALLLERAGEVITREELQQKLWPSDTFVDFDHSLNTAINKVREALGDSASSPRFVETLARRGYRFIAPVQGGMSREAVSGGLGLSSGHETASPVSARSFRFDGGIASGTRSTDPPSCAHSRSLRTDSGDVPCFLFVGAVPAALRAGDWGCVSFPMGRDGSCRSCADYGRRWHSFAPVFAFGGRF